MAKSNATHLRELRTTQPTSPKTLGERIRYARIACDMSITALADRIRALGGSSVDKSLVSRWERDTVKSLSSHNMAALCAATGFAYEWIASGRGPMRSTPNINSSAIARAIRTLAPDMTDKEIGAISGLYDVLVASPSLPDSALAAIAATLTKRA